ncbi:MAG: major capsid family protein [bacterium]
MQKRWNSREEFEKDMHQKYNGQRLKGLELFNANGDVAVDSVAYQYTMDRLSFIRQKTIEQTFYTVAPADYLPVIVGEGSFAQNIISNMSIKTSGGFKAGKLNTGNHNSKVNVADAMLVPKTTYIENWALGCEYTIFDVNQSLFSGNWDIVEAKHRARKMDWDLGIQDVAFIGDIDQLTKFPGLLTQDTSSVVNINTALITKKISAMSTTEFAALVAGLIAAYQTNCNQTRFPNVFVMPQDDYVGLAVPVSETYPMNSKLEYLKNAFNAIVPGGVKILPSAYGMAAYNTAAGVNKARYALYRDDIDTLFMEIPVNFTPTAAGTLNNFNFQDIAYGQYSGVTVMKPLEVLYLQY